MRDIKLRYQKFFELWQILNCSLIVTDHPDPCHSLFSTDLFPIYRYNAFLAPPHYSSFKAHLTVFFNLWNFENACPRWPCSTYCTILSERIHSHHHSTNYTWKCDLAPYQLSEGKNHIIFTICCTIIFTIQIVIVSSPSSLIPAPGTL